VSTSGMRRGRTGSVYFGAPPAVCVSWSFEVSQLEQAGRVQGVAICAGRGWFLDGGSQRVIVVASEGFGRSSNVCDLPNWSTGMFRIKSAV
jgi:hypothetical protein